MTQAALAEDAPKTDRAAQTRQSILNAAEILFDVKGYEAASTRDIAKAAGVAVGTVFAHFPDKSHLLGAVLAESMERGLSLARQPLPENTPLMVRLGTIACALYGRYDGRVGLARAYMAHTLFGGHEETRRFRAEFREIIALFKDRLDQAILRGELPAHLDSSIAARGIYADYLMVQVASLQAGKLNLDLMAEQFTLLTAQRLNLSR